MRCPVSGDTPDRCDDTDYGKGTGGQLTYDVDVPAGGRTVWFSVAGSDNGLTEAKAAQDQALANPGALLRSTILARRTAQAHTRVRLPGDRLLQRSVTWSKQNLAESVQESRDLKVRVTNAGKKYPAPMGTVPSARWFGAGFPDYPWLFGTDGEYTGFAAVAAGQFGVIKDHLRALRDVSLVANGDSGKVVHEVTPEGSVFFGANDDPGNTDETAKFPSTVALIWRWTGDDAFRDEMYDFAVSNMRYIYRELDADGDGWPEGLGNVERDGMGEEKLDNTVYTIRGLRDLADLARSKGDDATRQWAARKADDLQKRFDKAWWNGPDTRQYADSLTNPDNSQVFQRHWIGVTPAEAEITRPGRLNAPLAPLDHARALVARREQRCYTGTYGLFHTGTGPTSATGGNKGATCDSAVSSVQSERTVFTLNTSIMAVAEAALGRMGSGQLRRYTTDNALVQLDPKVWELPGGMPEISPSPDFGKNIEKRFTERSMALQAWGTYGILWPVVHYELGVTPDIGRDRVRVVPQVPSGPAHGGGAARPARRRPRERHGHPRVRPAGDRRTAEPGLAPDHRRAAADGRPRHGRPARRPPRRSPGAGQRAWSPGRRRRGQRPRRLRPDGALLPLTRGGFTVDPRDVHRRPAGESRRPAGGRNLRHPGRVDTLSSPDWHRRCVWNGERWAPTPYQQGRTALMVLAILVGMVLLALVVLAATIGPAVVAIYDTFH